MYGLSIAGAALAAGLTLFSSPVAAADADPIVIKGNHFFYKTNGSEFYLQGVAYQQDLGGNGSTSTTGDDNTFTDPLADNAGCDRDVPLLQELHANVIRVYAIDPTKDHSHCMGLLQQAGIYVISDLSSPDTSITTGSPEWNLDLYKRYTSVVDALSNYTNVIGFFAGNEVTNNASNIDALAFVKSAVRDMKTYVKTKSRPIYIGYASSDNEGIRTQIEDYLNCGPDAADDIDFFGFNIYSWCGDSNYQMSNYQARTEELAGYSVPAFFAEYGCNTNGERMFTETAALFGPNMTGVWSGGIVYEYFQEANNYGLVSVSGSTASKLPDFSNLATAIASVSPTILNSASYTPTATALRACPSGGNWTTSPTLAPAVDQRLCDCMVQSLSCVAKGNIASAATGELFDYICGAGQGSAGIDCSGIAGNGTSGQYGAYSMCDAQSRLSWAFNAYYSHQSNKQDACSFAGNGTTQSVKADSTCQSLVSQAGGTGGTGTSTAIPSNAAGSGSASSSKGVAGAVVVPSVDMGIVRMGVYVIVAMLAGAGIVLM